MRCRLRPPIATAAVAVVAIVAVSLLASGCGGGSAPRVASVRSSTTATTTTGSATGRGAGATRESLTDTALAFAQCMRTHGEPNFPEPSFHGRNAQITLHPGSGVDPSSPRFAAADNACKHLLPNKGAPSPGQAITLAEQADYIKAAACMRRRGIADFPDPSFRDGTVSFDSKAPIDTNSSRYRAAVATCQKLIPAGLPYSTSSAP